MGIPVKKEEFAVERRWTRLHLDKSSPTAAVLTEEIGVYRSDGVWAALQVQHHNLSPAVLELVLATPLKALGLGAKATAGDVLNALLYGMVSGSVLTTLTINPVVKDEATGEVLEGALATLLNAANGPHGPQPLPLQVPPGPGMQVSVHCTLGLPVTLDVPVRLGEWQPEVRIKRFTPIPPDSIAAIQAPVIQEAQQAEQAASDASGV